ncbi:putative efflux pump outer membrane protein TtgC precursor [compost metagenome]|uniref:efflux transporter outer membrane subunit n=1 Tax=Pseudomonas sp. TaxID=306 RepID=UPI000FA3546D
MRTIEKIPAFTCTRLPLALGLPLALALLAGCSLTPDYSVPDEARSWVYKEAPALPQNQTGSWKQAQPAEDQLRGQWWQVFADPRLNQLEEQAALANPGLHAAAARLKQARALQRDARADRMPRVDAAFGPSRQRESPASLDLPDDGPANTFTLWRAELGISYEVDLAGRIDAQVEAATAELEKSGALYRTVLLALQADVAEHYFLIRELDTQLYVYRRTLELRNDTYRLIKHRHDNGDAGELDLVRAHSELEAARSEALGVERNRASAEHALAILLGLPPAKFSLEPQLLVAKDIAIPPGLPSSLLERRPDIAAAERAMAAANARVGIAKAAFFPKLELTAAGGFESSELGNLFEWSSRTFLLGPLVGAAMTLPLFDGGRRQAGVDYSQAAYEEDAARYREVVLKAFGEVEDNLALLRIMAEQSRAQQIALAASERAAELSHLQYREGSHTQLDTIDADRTMLTQQLATARLNGDRARSTVRLIRALGGGWEEALKQQHSIASNTQEE